jgi:HSP20 family protein
MSSLLPSLWGHAEKDDAPFRSLHREIDKVFEDFNRSFGLPAFKGAGGEQAALLTPKIDVVESDGTIEVTAELPGVAQEDVDVTLHENVLTIKGEKKAEKSEEKKDYRLVERSYGSFQRSMRLPFEVPDDSAEATFKDGVLKVVLRKPPEVEAKTRKIAINADSQ